VNVACTFIGVSQSCIVFVSRLIFVQYYQAFYPPMSFVFNKYILNNHLRPANQEADTFSANAFYISASTVRLYLSDWHSVLQLMNRYYYHNEHSLGPSALSALLRIQKYPSPSAQDFVVFVFFNWADVFDQ
jgi:hypothetical protein